MKAEITAVRIILDGVITHLELLADENDSPLLEELIDMVDEANDIAGELEEKLAKSE